MSHLQAGAAKANITPYVGAFLAGFGNRDRGSEGIHDELFARALVVQAGETTVALVACDLIGLTRDSVAAIRERIEAATGIPPGHVMIACTHTHSGPTMGILRHPVVDVELVHVTERKIAGAAIAAHRAMAPASLGVGKGRARIGINRRERRDDGSTRIGRNPQGITDDEVGVLRVDDASGRPMALFVNHSCHAVVLGGNNYLVSADFPGQLAAFLEAAYPGAVCGFLNGTAGNINPEPACGTSFEDARRLGFRLGAEAIQVAEGLQTERPVAASGSLADAASVPRSACPTVRENGTAGQASRGTSGLLAARQAVIEVPLAELPSADEARRMIAQRQAELDAALAKGEISRVLYEHDWQLRWAHDVLAEHAKPERQRTVPLEIQALRLGDALLIGTPGETFAEIGLAIKAASPMPNTFVVGYANGVFGYIPTAKAFEEGGYEVTGAYKFYRSVYFFTPAVEKLVTEAAVALARSASVRPSIAADV